jgi:co-chaperonin GroES (HSP10)
MKCKMTPAGQHVHIKPDTADQKIGLIIVPIMAQKRPPAGVVVSVSEDAEFEVKSGDRVVYEANAGCELEGGILSMTEDKILYKE